MLSTVPGTWEVPGNGSYEGTGDTNEEVTSLPGPQFPHLRNALSGALALDNEALSLSDLVLCDLRAEVLPHRGETSDCATAHRGPQQVTAHGVTSEGCSPPAPPMSGTCILSGSAADGFPGLRAGPMEARHLMRAPRWSFGP